MAVSKLEQLDNTIQIVNQREFDVSDLPILVPAINQCFEEVDFTYKKLSRLIEKDPILTNAIFQLVNCGIFKRPEVIKSLDSALMLLGFSMIRNLIFTLKLKHLLTRHSLSIQVSLAKRWLFTLKHASYAMELAKMVNMKKAEEIFLAIIFSDIAAFMLADRIHKKDQVFDEADFYKKADKLKFVYGYKTLKAWDFSSQTLSVLNGKDTGKLSEFDIVRLAYFHIKKHKDIATTNEFSRLPMALQMTYGKNQLLILKEKQADLQNLITSLS